MKTLIAAVTLVFFYGQFASSQCADSFSRRDVCNEMKHLRSQILALGEQRDLLQINYPYLQAIGEEISQSCKAILSVIVTRDTDKHVEGLVEIQKISTDFLTIAKGQNPDTLRLANLIQAKCASCHAKETPQSGHAWDEIFKLDWSAFYKRCNTETHNPLYCKHMFGMLSSYSYFVTANSLKRFNFNMTKLAASEIHRLIEALKNLKIYHGGESFIQNLENKTTAVVKLAEIENPDAYAKGLELGHACMSCHGEKIFDYRD